MSLGTTRFWAPTAAGSNANKRHTAIFVLMVAADPRSGTILPVACQSYREHLQPRRVHMAKRTRSGHARSLERRDGALQPANVQAFIRRAPRMADKTSWTKPRAPMTYGDSIVAAGGLEAGR